MLKRGGATFLVILSALGFSVGTPWAQEGQLPEREEDFSQVGGRSGEFLAIPIGARGVGLGNAASAIVDDVSAVFWNPANMGFVDNPQFFYSFVDLPLQVKMSSGAFAFPVFAGDGTIMAMAQVLNVGDIEITTEFEPNGTNQFFSGFSFAGGLGYAHEFSDRFSAGVIGKFIFEEVADLDADAVAFDGGTNYHTTLFGRSVRLGFAFRNLGTKLRFSGSPLLVEVPAEVLDPSGLVTVTRETRRAELVGGAFSLPTDFRIGLAYNVVDPLLTGGAFTWTLAGEFIQPNNLEEFVAFGTELKQQLSSGPTSPGYIVGRAGWSIQQDEIGLSDSVNDLDILRGLGFGAGLFYNFGAFNAGFDFAYRDRGRLNEDYVLSVTVGF